MNTTPTRASFLNRLLCTGVCALQQTGSFIQYGAQILDAGSGFLSQLIEMKRRESSGGFLVLHNTMIRCIHFDPLRYKTQCELGSRTAPRDCSGCAAYSAVAHQSPEEAELEHLWQMIIQRRMAVGV